jgi:hypothetical protein
MAQTGFTPIQLYRTTTASAAPTAGNLADGELAINTTDEKLYFKNAGGTVKLLAANVTAVANGGTGATDAATARTNLGLGSMATQAAGSVAITGGSITGITDLAIADGGTGASTAANARTNLGLGTAATMAGPSGAIVGTTDTQTLTNKWIQPRVLASTANSATPTLNTDSYDMMVITGQSVAITSFTTNLTGTPVNGQKIWIAITGTTAIAITWGASFEASTVPLPTTTVSTNRLDVGFVWNVASSKWRCVAAA